MLQGIESDGRCVARALDPPGQRSVYINPGDPQRETYRLSTFKDFPRNVPINPCQFARNGFYFTGYKDRVKCFSCGQACEHWTIEDDVTSPAWHKPHCSFINGCDTSNIPIQSRLYHNTSTRSMFRKVSNSGRGSQSNDTTTARNNWMKSNMTSQSSSRQSAARTNDASTSSSSVVASSHSNGSSNRNEAQNSNDAIFPCLHPVSPHMRSVESRLQTFADNSRNWPTHRIRATPREIAESGMFYLGERDRVKCWYCNGGLQNWQRDDDPWFEHAKWFPMCEFVLQRKGPDFVHAIVAQFPNLRRRTLHFPTAPEQITSVGRTVSSSSFPSSSSRNNDGPVIIDPREELRKVKRRVESEMTSSQIVAQAKLMGFEEKDIKAALIRRFETTDSGFSSVDSFVEAILSVPESFLFDISNEEEAKEKDFNSHNDISNTDSLVVMQRLEESRKCKICRSEKACVVFIPCGHLACCVQCGSLANCPACKSAIRERVRSYIA